MRRLAALLCLIGLPTAAGPLSAVQTARLSAELYAAGVATDDPLLMVAAAKLRKSMGEPQQVAMRWQDMLARAEPLANDDGPLLEVIDDLNAEKPKRLTKGPVYNIGKLAAGASNSHVGFRFPEGAYAEVYVEAAADALNDLNIEVQDAEGRLVCKDQGPGPTAYCGWTAAVTPSFVVTVHNSGPDSAYYVLIAN